VSKRNLNEDADEDVWELSCIASGNTVYENESTLEENLALLYQTKHSLTIRSNNNNCAPWCLQNELKMYSHTETET
jgi:hypothetical protein